MATRTSTPTEDFGEWVAPWLPDVWRFAVSLSSLDDADDLVQDALARAWAKRASFDPSRGSARSWLLAIVADRARRRWMRRPKPVPVEPSDVAEPDGRRVDLRRAIAGLPERQRTTIYLHYYLDLPVREVARVLGCADGTVKSTLHDARRALARRLEDDDA
ncbi:MAG TPA: RNA polymerase sigma factor [Jatrophihabitans sp.]|jgi:RNA polymerase sigma-70 factor (ECF subfamily)